MIRRMDTYKFKKAELLEIIRTNRDNHKAIFEEALDGYKKLVIEKLEDSLKRARNGQKVNLYFNLLEPINQTKDYNRIIKMLEMTVDDIIELDEASFSQYVMDDWSWKQNFLTSNAMYSATATRALNQLQTED